MVPSAVLAYPSSKYSKFWSRLPTLGCMGWVQGRLVRDTGWFDQPEFAVIF